MLYGFVLYYSHALYGYDICPLSDKGTKFATPCQHIKDAIQFTAAAFLPKSGMIEQVTSWTEPVASPRGYDKEEG